MRSEGSAGHHSGVVGDLTHEFCYGEPPCKIIANRGRHGEDEQGSKQSDKTIQGTKGKTRPQRRSRNKVSKHPPIYNHFLGWKPRSLNKMKAKKKGKREVSLVPLLRRARDVPRTYSSSVLIPPTVRAASPDPGRLSTDSPTISSLS